MAEPKRKAPARSASLQSTPPAELQPTSQGHRFGPSLLCCWCGVSYQIHHTNPKPCRRDPAAAPEIPRPS